MQVTIEGMKCVTLRAGLRTSIRVMGATNVCLVLRGRKTFLAGRAYE